MQQESRAKSLNGTALAERLETELRSEVQSLRSVYGKSPTIAVILVGDDPASAVYVGRKEKACTRVGIESRAIRLPDSTSHHELMGLIEELNLDANVNGILVQLPLPDQINAAKVLSAIVPYKDVDAFHPENVGHALIGDETMAPCTPQGILQLLDEAKVVVEGKDVVIVNHSNIIGKPLAAMLINRNATVTVCHKFTKDLASHTSRADILITGTGKLSLITGKHVKKGAVVVDVSMNRTPEGKLAGDCTDDVWDVASWVTPVPGGVGPMTISVLLQNTVRSFKRKMGILPST